MRRNLISVALLVLALTVAGCTQHVSTSVDAKSAGVPKAKLLTLTQKVERAVKALEGKVFVALVTDQVVMEILKRLVKYDDLKDTPSHSINFRTRRVMFDTHLCPVFKNKKQCWNALYAAYTGGKQYYKHDKLPLAIDGPLNRARKYIMKTARAHLQHPDQLQAFYQSKKVSVLKSYLKYDDAKRAAFKKWLKNARLGLKAFQDPKFYALWQQYVAAGKRYQKTHKLQEAAAEAHRTATNRAAPDLPFALKKALKGRPGSHVSCEKKGVCKLSLDVPVPKAYRKQVAELMRLEEAWLKQTRLVYKLEDEEEGYAKRMRKFTPDFYASLFAGRRHQEGGTKLVQAWINVTTDLEKLLANL